MEKLPVEIRTANAGDVAFIFNAWLRSYQAGTWLNKFIPHKIFYSKHHKLIEDLIRNPNTSLLVACDPTDNDTIFGFACGETLRDNTNGKDYLILHYVYCKEGFRNKSLAKTLISALPAFDKETIFFTSHLTYSWLKVAPRFKTFHDPYHLYK